MNHSTLFQAKALMKKGDLKAALQLCEEVINADPQNALAYQSASIAQADLGNDSEALTLSAKALELDPNLIVPHITRAYVLDRVGKTEESQVEAKTAVEKDPESSDALCCLGIILLTANKTDEAKRYLEKAVAINPSYYLAQYHLTRVYLGIKDPRKVFWQSLILFRLKPNIENILRLAYVFSRASRFTNLLILLISAFLSLWIEPKFILIITFLLVSISVSGGIFAGFLAKGTQWVQFLMSLALGVAIGIIGLSLYLVLNNIYSR